MISNVKFCLNCLSSEALSRQSKPEVTRPPRRKQKWWSIPVGTQEMMLAVTREIYAMADTGDEEATRGRVFASGFETGSPLLRLALNALLKPRITFDY